MWMFYAIGSAFFAGITAILAKCGIRETDSDVATAIRTIVVLLFSWLMVMITGTWTGITEIDGKTLLFLVLSGLATGASWLCYFHALRKGDINKVVPIDKSSTVLTILLALIFLHEGLTWGKAASIILIGAGTLLMVSSDWPNGIKVSFRVSSDLPNSTYIRKSKKAFFRVFGKESNVKKEQEARGWLIYAVMSAVFASLTAILGKVGITGIDSNLGTAIRTMVVLIMAWLMVFISGKRQKVKKIQKDELGFIVLSGLATGASWLCYYRALQGGPASVVVPIDKLSILITIVFSWVVFHEKLTKKTALGVVCITVGTVLLAVI